MSPPFMSLLVQADNIWDMKMLMSESQVANLSGFPTLQLQTERKV